jgi:hypothetical protein
MVIGAYQANTNRGEVYVYQRNGNTWTQRGQTLQGVNNYDEFGFDVSINNNGNTIAVGIKGWDDNPNNTTYEIGQTAIYDWDGSQWVQRGTAIEGSNIFDQCGYAVSLSGDGDRIAVGYRASNHRFHRWWPGARVRLERHYMGAERRPHPGRWRERVLWPQCGTER